MKFGVYLPNFGPFGDARDAEESGWDGFFKGITPSRLGLKFGDEWPYDRMRERILQGPSRNK